MPNGGLKPAIERFEADRIVVSDARPVRLEWAVSGALRVEITGVGDVTGRTSVDVPVRRDTTFTLTVVPLAGRPISQSLDVTVSRAPASIVRFTSSKTRVREGDEIVLEWEARNAAEVSIAPRPGVVAAAGRVPVRLARTTTFTLTATSCFGVRTTAMAVVNVVASTKLVPASRRTALRAPAALPAKRTVLRPGRRMHALPRAAAT